MLYICCTFTTYVKPAYSFLEDNIVIRKSGLPVIEYLRLHVPTNLRADWLASEKDSWEPWLKTKEGFIERQLFWNPDKEEAMILISWENRTKWKSIPLEEINSIQAKFEENARIKTGRISNPFPLIYEGELLSQ